MCVKVFSNCLAFWAKVPFKIRVWAYAHTFCFCIIIEVLRWLIRVAIPTMVEQIGDVLHAIWTKPFLSLACCEKAVKNVTDI